MKVHLTTLEGRPFEVEINDILLRAGHQTVLMLRGGKTVIVQESPLQLEKQLNALTRPSLLVA